MGTSNSTGLSPESLGHLRYLYDLFTQPTGSWDGFYIPQSPSMNFALRYQLAFGTYALAGLLQRTPAYRAPYAEAIRGAIEKMLEGAAWNYWRAPSRASSSSTVAQSGHVAVLVSPHTRAPAGPPSDPIAQDNLQYSGHLSTMLGLYEKVSGDDRYDHSFSLQDAQSGVEYAYTHSDVAGRIHSQMRESGFGGVCCESGMAYVPCNNHALASNALHDALHGTHFHEANARWLRSVRDKMVLKGPALRGIFGAAYVKDLHMAAPVAFNFTDAWGLAFMLPFDRTLVRKLYGKFRRRVTHAGADGAYLGSAPFSEKSEISDVAINTGFALILAKGMGDEKLAGELERYSSGAFGAGWHGSCYFYKDAPRTLHASALFALASSMEPGGTGFSRMFNAKPDPAIFSQPTLDEVHSDSGDLGVSRAEYDPSTKVLSLGIRRLGDAASMREGIPVEALLSVSNVPGEPRVEAGGSSLEYTRDGSGRVRISVDVEPIRETEISVRLN